ncbi:hypothetical protein Cpin_4647 [Chitinophaga pinensis DSM 2588]|uniref:Secreted protein n=1 Tax=Chitinophaga pinensis (strain ATCC 43595 / DSM 2588 / LMG 13176 / NBRC 15968 / NCIMB 11800 / UQM 2034) TaxID=485918 RepID=A0A979G7E5_CHIPD|nr:hypothetical protein Cpin_4647 [Chitinophaga pinensis DSM 2588]
MNRAKKLAFCLLTAVFAFGFSSFNNHRPYTVYRYYKVDMTYPNASDYRGYVYYSGDLCVTGGNLCSALWSINDPLPAEGSALPSSSNYMGGVIHGHVEL